MDANGGTRIKLKIITAAVLAAAIIVSPTVAASPTMASAAANNPALKVFASILDDFAAVGLLTSEERTYFQPLAEPDSLQQERWLLESRLFAILGPRILSLDEVRAKQVDDQLRTSSWFGEANSIRSEPEGPCEQACFNEWELCMAECFVLLVICVASGVPIVICWIMFADCQAFCYAHYNLCLKTCANCGCPCGQCEIRHPGGTLQSTPIPGQVAVQKGNSPAAILLEAVHHRTDVDAATANSLVHPE